MKSPYLFAAIQMVIASFIGWIGIVVVMVMDMASLTNILLCIAGSFILAVPFAVIVQKKITKA